MGPVVDWTGESRVPATGPTEVDWLPSKWLRPWKQFKKYEEELWQSAVVNLASSEEKETCLSKKNNAYKKNTFNYLCASFTDACNEAVNLEDSSDDRVNELIDILRNATSSNQNFNESDIAAIKVTNLLIPAVNFISVKTVAKSNNAQDAKISKICPRLRINSYETKPVSSSRKSFHYWIN